ncbi:MAG: FtsQ-type POTRA domain-containing protein [Treponema sp.]|jgi:cell division protein FtsQ|nr:FtsQ-type POTRA domain-containing protein [Treponema sp.]
MSGESIRLKSPPPEAGRRSGDTGQGIEKGLKALIIAAAAILVLELIWLLAVSPCMPLAEIETPPFPGLSREEIIAAAGIGERSSYVSVKAARAERSLEALCQVESAKVIKRFPNAVKIVLIPRSAAGVSLARLDGKLTPVYFDRTGLVFKIGKEDGEAAGDLPQLPLISGLVFENPSLGMKLPALFGPLLSRLEAIRDSSPELLAAISEIRINRKAFDGFDLVLYPVHNPVRVRLEPDLNEASLRYVMLMLDVFAAKHSEIEEIDFRAETASYKEKEAPSGE